MKFVQLAKSLKEGLSPVYLVDGDEAYFRDHAVKAIREACALSLPDLNDVRLEGEAVKGERLSRLLGELKTSPMLDNYRLVRLYEYYPSEREWENGLGRYAASPTETTVLVIVNTMRKGCDLRKKQLVYVDCSRETEEMLARWVYGVARRAELDFDADAAGLFVRYCNSDAARMKLEIEKLSLLLGKGGKVSRSTVEEYVAKDVEYKIYELTQAASRGNRSAFSEILHDLMEKGFDESAALSALVSHYRTLTEIGSMRGTDAEIGSALGIKPYAVQKNRETASRLGKERVREVYLALYGLSAGMRSGLYTKSGALSAAIAKIFFG